jgi:hypothetical protein
MNSVLITPKLFVQNLLSTSWELENFIIAFVANDDYSGLFHIHYLSTGRKFTGNYFVMAEHRNHPIEITLIALTAKFRFNDKGEIKASHFIYSYGADLPKILNSIIDIY